MAQKILRRPQVQEKTGRGCSWIYEQMALGKFPKPVKLGADAKAVGWIEAEIDQWIADRIAARDAEQQQAA